MRNGCRRTTGGVLSALLALPCWAADVPIIEAFAGGGPDDMPALDANLTTQGVTSDAAGNLYVGTYTHMYRIDPSGHLRRIGGNGEQRGEGDGGPALDASLTTRDVALDPAGRLIFSDVQRRGIGFIDLRTERIGTLARLGSIGPDGIDVDAAGNVFVADDREQHVYRVDGVTAAVTVVAGNGTWGFGGDGGPAVDAAFRWPGDVVADADGNLYVADFGNHRVRRVDAATGIITTIAGNGIAGFSGDGGPASAASLNRPRRLALDTDGNLLIVDMNNYRVRSVDLRTGAISTFAGNGSAVSSGDGGPATAAGMRPYSLHVEPDGNVLIGSGPWIRRVDAGTGIITTIAGNGHRFFSGDGYRATQAALFGAERVAADARGNVFIADTENNRVRRVDAETGIITTVAGNGKRGSTGDGGPATDASLTSPGGVAVDAEGNLYIADTGRSWLPQGGNRIRRVDARSGIITTVAGTGQRGFSGDGGPASGARLAQPEGIEVDARGNLYIADTWNQRVRLIDARSGVISTIAGTGRFASNGDGGPATDAALAIPNAVGLDRRGNVYVVDTGGLYFFQSNKIRRIDARTGIISTVAGNGAGYPYQDGVPATETSLAQPRDIAVDPAGNLYITDQVTHRIRVIDARTGFIDTIAGLGRFGSRGDGGPALDAEMMNPKGIALDPRGRLYVADPVTNPRVRRIVFPNRAPLADAGPDQSLECASPDGTAAELDGSATVDLDGDPLTFRWTGPFREGGGTVGGVRPTVTLPFGAAEIELVADDGESASEPETVVVTIDDTLAPSGEVTGPVPGSCHGPAALPVMVEDDFDDLCDAELDRRYEPGPGPAFFDHGDHRVKVVASDDAGNVVEGEVAFTIDAVPPTVTLAGGPDPTIALPAALPLELVFRSDDDDGATGGVARELIRLEGCTILDGTVHGDGDGLLSDETIVLDRATLCAAAARCGLGGVLPRPALTVEATDCGGNTARAGIPFRGALRLLPGICSGRRAGRR